MKVIAINGSPRKKWNTATLLEKVIEGVASQGAKTELVHLYDLSFKGCISCFACKLKDGKSYGRCAVQARLTFAGQQHERPLATAERLCHLIDRRGNLGTEGAERLLFGDSRLPVSRAVGQCRGG